MLNEWEEFLQYSLPVTYTATGKRDSTYLGRFTFDTLAVPNSRLCRAMSMQIIQNMRLDIGILSIYILIKKSYLKHRMFEVKLFVHPL